MGEKILVAYASAAGATTGVAEAIADTLRASGSEVDLCAVKDVKDVADYRAVVVGSGVRAGKVYSDFVNFLGRHEDALSKIPVAYFVVCLTMVDPTEENRAQVLYYIAAVREKIKAVKPVDVQYFAGEFDPKKLPLPLRLIMKAMKAPQGDHRDWKAIREWASSLPAKFLA